jgi:ketosteroid isomerase-like protein
MDRLAAIRDIYREWERGNYRAGLELYDPGMTLEVHNPIPDAGVYEGVAGLQRYMRGFLST